MRLPNEKSVPFHKAQQTQFNILKVCFFFFLHTESSYFINSYITNGTQSRQTQNNTDAGLYNNSFNSVPLLDTKQTWVLHPFLQKLFPAEALNPSRLISRLPWWDSAAGTSRSPSPTPGIFQSSFKLSFGFSSFCGILFPAPHPAPPALLHWCCRAGKWRQNKGVLLSLKILLQICFIFSSFCIKTKRTGLLWSCYYLKYCLSFS